MAIQHVFLCILIAMFIMALMCARTHRSVDPFASMITQTATISSSNDTSSSNISNSSSSSTVTISSSPNTTTTLTVSAPATQTAPAPTTATPAPAPILVVPATVADMPAEVSEELFGKILAVYKQAVANYQLTWQTVQTLPIQRMQEVNISVARTNAYLQSITPTKMTADQQMQVKTLQDQDAAAYTLYTQRLEQADTDFMNAQKAIVLVLQLLDAAYARRTFPGNVPTSAPVSSVSPQIPMPPAKTPQPLFLKSNGMWESAGPRGYIAATCSNTQKMNGFQPFLFDTLLTVIGSTISLQVTPTAGTFVLAPGYMYSCRAEIAVADSCVYTWYANGIPFGSFGMTNYRDRMNAAATGYIKNNTSELMRVTLARSNMDDSRNSNNITGIGMFNLYMGPIATIEEIATI